VARDGTNADSSVRWISLSFFWYSLSCC
jgi:hypothetical protein